MFNKETDSESLALDIVAFLRKWGMWQDVQIFTGGKCYTDDHGELVVRDERHPENYLEGVSHYDCNGHTVWKDLSNPERFLDMTFEGAFSTLLRHHHYEVKIGDLSDEVKRLIIPKTNKCIDEVDALMDEYLEGKYSWDPAEFDSYKEWMEFGEHPDIDSFIEEAQSHIDRKVEFSSREEYYDFLLRLEEIREDIVTKYFEDEISEETYWDLEVFCDSGDYASMIIQEFENLLEKYGLWYDLCFSWSLTTYRKGE